MKKKTVLLFICLLILSSNVLAASPVANPPGELRVVVMASDSPNFIDEWVSTPSSHDVHVKPLKEVSVEKMFHVAAIVTGYEIDASMMTNLSGDFILEDSDKTVQADEKNILIHQKKFKGNERTGFVMLDPAIDLTFTDEDKTGVYTIKIVVRDHVSGKTATGEYQITLKEENPPDSAADLLTAEIVSAAQLDQLWQAFLTTGDEKYVIRIINTLAWSDSQTKDLQNRLIGSAAKWSLMSHAKQYPQVLEICKKELEVQSGVIKEELKTILQTVKSN
ncbi:MAG: hypothetical protein COV74_04040 [Candidatus Omnitrophica bacterium CG11_big_fil_rev_8_21_14_0_20_45_26]|uniref:Cadherin domain-containing protein n=1 Tax=Candidatus Abzuiibacterium crystallinum TaxID=1974748 RepID=A0A2H0LST2_9BACT|nr:MAG: hypothetical protein COV74_04040 [Candidatus Omnitrophica bacterium CG11_big_fil_rev_8_21_14_0_20_45_26]PIW65287.1 MAG: hypothetical protein COW12_02820 [Candidatus Omnitrophica bacterium CG12_big_fil_rev_8_21_14_0_65_45_16]